MAQSCTYTFNGPDGKEVTIRGMAAMKAYLVDGGMEFFQTKGVRFDIPATFSFAGSNAQTADKMALSTAQQRIKAGEDAETVRQETGWFKGKDGKWRFEISDDAAAFNTESSNPDAYADIFDEASSLKDGVPLGRLLDHPALFAAYPGLKAIRVRVNDRSSNNGSYSAEDNTIELRDPYSYKGGVDKALSVLLHEIQHGIQNVEGFASGGSPAMMDLMTERAPNADFVLGLEKWNYQMRRRGYPDDKLMEFDDLAMNERETIIADIEDQATWLAHTFDLSESRIDQMLLAAFGESKLQDMVVFDNLDPYQQYRALAGEVEARNTQSRQRMTDAERRATPPSATTDVADADVILMFNGKVMQNAPKPSNLVGASSNPDPSNQRITRAQADGFLSGFLAKYANAPQITLVNTFDQLPATVQQEARNQGGNASDTKGVFHRGQVYLVAGNHSTVADFEATVFHEVIGHAGVRALFGDDFVKTANRLFMQLGGQAGLVKIMQRRGMGQQASDYLKGIAQAQRKELDQIRADMAAGKPGAQRRWNDTIARFVLTEEVFAHIAEQVKDRPSMMDKMKELIGKIRQWLRDKGFAELSSLGETDILFMLSKARQSMLGNGGNITRNGVTVSGNDLMTSDGRRLNKDDPDYASAMRLADLLGLRQEQGVTTFRSDPEGDTPAVLSRAPSATQQQGKGRIGAAVDSFLNGRNDMPEWLAQMPAETQEAARKAGIWTQQKPLAERLKDIRQNALKRLQQGLLDQFAPLKELGEREYVLARLTKSADAPLESLLLYGRPFMNDAGAIDVNLENGGLIGALQDLNGEHDRFFAWIAGNRAEQLKKEGRENLFTDTDISALKDMNDGTMADGRSRKAVYESMLLKFNSYSKSVLDIAEKAGIIAKEDRAIWEKDFYVPFYRAMEDGEYKGPKTASGLVNQYAFKKLQGGTDNLNDLMQNTLRNWSHLLSASLKNQAAAAALSSAEKAGVAVPVSQKQKGSVSYLGRVKRKIPQGQTYTENGVQKVSDGTAEIETIGEKHFMVEDPFILDAITSLEWAGWNNPAMKWMQRAKHYLTLGVTISPTFKIRNLIRDQISAIGLNPMSYNVMNNLSQGWKGTDKDSAEYAKMLAGGGLMRFGTFLEDDRAQHMKRLIDAGVEDSTILTSSEKVKAALGKAWDWWQEVGDRSENITRAAIYKQRFDQLVKEGKTQDEAHLLASFAARDSMDFSLQGQWGSIRFLTQLVPFLNARLQGLYKLGRDGVAPTVRLVTGNAEMGDKERAQRFGAVVGTVALASIALMLAYEDDEDWKNREEWDRDTYWWFKVGDTAYRIPKPFEIGAIGTLAERGLETAMNGFDKESRRIFVERLGAMLTGTFAMNPVPQLFKPLIDLYANTDSFTGRPIETMGMERLSKSERIGVGTSATAQLIGKATSLVGLSPVQVDHLIDGYFSWLGTHLAMTADFALRPMMGLPDKPARKWPDGYFVVGDFAKDLPANQSRYLTQFYEQSKKVQEAMADIRYYQSLGMTEKAMKLSQENKDEIQLYKTYSAAQRQIGEINKHIRMVQMSDKDAAVKRDEIDRLTQARNKIAELTETRRAALQ